MKNILFISIVFIFSTQSILSQSINWQSLKENQSSMVYANMGYQFGMKTQLGYGLKLQTDKAIILTSDFSIPMGAKIIDDFQFRIGGQAELLRVSNFSFSTALYAITRRHKTNWTQQFGMATELTFVGAYCTDKWHLGLEFGLDKNVATKINHGEFLQNNYPEIKDAWYLNSGGNIMLGLQASRTLGTRSSLNLKLGLTNALANHVDALIPFYFQLGFIYQ